MTRFLIVFLFPCLAFSWGGRGHDAICQASSFLVKDKTLREFLQHRSHVMGHLCNIPDTYWRGLPAEITKTGNPTHFIDPEVIGLKISEIPLDYSKILKNYTGTENKFKKGAKIYSIPNDFGSVWWRVDQFVRRISALDFKSAPPPERKQEQDEKYPYNAQVYEMMVNMGLMGHFVGDAAQPFHNSADYDGYEAGHGGIHSYYETEVVSMMDASLTNEILKRAKLLKEAPFLKGPTTLEKMRIFSDVAAKDMPKILKLDPVTKKSVVIKEKGMEIKTAAERKSAEAGLKVFKPLIVEQMARATVMLAHLWDESYKAAGKPDLSKYRSYKYPYSPDFVAPDYISDPKN